MKGGYRMSKHNTLALVLAIQELWGPSSHFHSKDLEKLEQLQGKKQEEWWKDQSICFTVWDARWSIYLTHQRDGLEVTWSQPMSAHMGNRNLLDGFAI